MPKARPIRAPTADKHAVSTEGATAGWVKGIYQVCGAAAGVMISMHSCSWCAQLCRCAVASNATAQASAASNKSACGDRTLQRTVYSRAQGALKPSQAVRPMMLPSTLQKVLCPSVPWMRSSTCCRKMVNSVMPLASFSRLSPSISSRSLSGPPPACVISYASPL